MQAHPDFLQQTAGSFSHTVGPGGIFWVLKGFSHPLPVHHITGGLHLDGHVDSSHGMIFRPCLENPKEGLDGAGENHIAPPCLPAVPTLARVMGYAQAYGNAACPVCTICSVCLFCFICFVCSICSVCCWHAVVALLPPKEFFVYLVPG
ncbi:hypothetical protein MAP00_008753 [Monascus purpureus]|nr:hypothetical protein MAP00_008753 [Monascus purpureus]